MGTLKHTRYLKFFSYYSGKNGLYILSSKIEKKNYHSLKLKPVLDLQVYLLLWRTCNIGGGNTDVFYYYTPRISSLGVLV